MTYPPQGPTPPGGPYPQWSGGYAPGAPQQRGYPQPLPVAPPPSVRPLPPARAGVPGGNAGAPVAFSPPPPFGLPQAAPPPRPVMPPPAVAHQVAAAPGSMRAAPSSSPQWTQPAYPGAYRPAKKSRAGSIIGLSLGAVAVLVLGLIGSAASALHHSSRRVEAGYTTTYPTYDTGSSLPTSAGATTAAGRTTRSPARRTTGTAANTPGGPPKVEQLASNPLFGRGAVPPVTCNFTRYQHTPAGQQKLLTEGLVCLDAMWKPILAGAGLPYATPQLAFPTGKNWSSPCGSVTDGEAAAFYCTENNTLYMPWTGLQSDEYGPQPGIYLAVLAHEYGHHVQNVTGISSAYQKAAYDAATAQALELSRRLELEAQCFSGNFFAAAQGKGSFDRTVVAQAEATQQRGDTPGGKRDHGTNAHAQSWWDLGLQRHATQQCNTWAAAAADVA